MGIQGAKFDEGSAKLIGGCLGLLVYIGLLTWGFQAVWNSGFFGAFDLPIITFWQSFAIVAVVKVLVGKL